VRGLPQDLPLDVILRPEPTFFPNSILDSPRWIEAKRRIYFAQNPRTSSVTAR
jgi:hypothetical protein